MVALRGRAPFRASSFVLSGRRLRRRGRARDTARVTRGGDVAKGSWTGFSACTSGGRPRVAYVYFLQLTPRDSPRATRPSLTTAVFTTTMKRTSAAARFARRRAAPRRTARACTSNAPDWLILTKTRRVLNSRGLNRLLGRDIYGIFTKNPLYTVITVFDVQRFLSSEHI